MGKRRAHVLGWSVLAVGAVAAVLFATTAFLLWRYPAQQDVGGGVLVDRGPLTASERYVVDFGLVDFRINEEHTYHVERLPQDELTIGFEVASPNLEAAWELLEKRGLPGIVVGLTVLNERGQVVIEEEASLQDWVWGSPVVHVPYGAFVYRRGEEERVEISPTVSEVQSVNVKADGGWGTYFAPRKRGKYAITLKVIGSGDEREIPKARLLIMGGGWKSNWKSNWKF